MGREHPDMSGNIHDQPLTCHKCGCDVREDHVYGSDAYPDLNFCGLQCLSEWQDSELQRLQSLVRAMPTYVQTPAEHNCWVEELKDGVEFQPLREFLDTLKEPE